MPPNLSTPLTPQELRLERRISEARLGDVLPTRTCYLGLWRVWERRLLSHGGVLVKHPSGPEPDLEHLHTRADVIHVDPYGDRVLFVEGAPHECHANAAALWRQRRTPGLGHVVTGIGSGYALSGDGLWRQHSWAVTSSGRIVETTEPCLAYAGFMLSEQEAKLFAALNVLYV